MAGQHLTRPDQPGVEQVCCRLCFRSFCHCRQRSQSHLLGIGIGHTICQILVAQDKHKAMFFHRRDEDFHTGQLDLLQQLAQFAGLLCGNAARPPVGDEAILINSAKVSPRGHVVGAKIKANAYRFKHTASNLVPERIVPKQREVCRPTTRSNSSGDGNALSTDTFSGQLVQVGRLRGLQFGLTIRCQGQTTQAVHNYHDDLGLFFQG